MRLFPFSLLYSFLVVIVLVSCASKPEGTLTGRWQEAGGKETLGFQKDGTFDARLIWDLTRTPIELGGTYSEKGDTVTLNVVKPPNLAPMVLRIKFSPSNEELTVTFQQGGAIKLDGSVSAYHRIK